MPYKEDEMNEEQLKKRIELTEHQCRQAMEDYSRYVINDHDYYEKMDSCISDRFYKRLAKDSVIAKSGLRDFFEQSENYDPILDAIVLKADKDKEPNILRIHQLVLEILDSAIKNNTISKSLAAEIAAFCEFTNNSLKQANPYGYNENIKRIIENFPDLYRNNRYDENRRRSRVFKSICDRLKVTDNSKGSEFQIKFAELADEMNAKTIPFRLYLSINACHFLTMSNPKGDRRGNMLTSCHSFNSTEYDYNNGCIGYARDSVTMIAFTVDDNNFSEEALNNRKTSRQLYMYMPHNFTLLQSRLYNTHGGTSGEQETTKLYRHMIEREISKLEGLPNLWALKKATSQDSRKYYFTNGNFGGYPDWEYTEFDPRLAIHKNADRTKLKKMQIGAAGLCINCGCENSDGLYCNSCNDEESEFYCDCCGEYRTGQRFFAYENGSEITICEECKDEYYHACDDCGRLVHWDMICDTVYDTQICDGCALTHYTECRECGDVVKNEDAVTVYDKDGNEIRICRQCLKDFYQKCDSCGKYYKPDMLHKVFDTEEKHVCDTCLNDSFELNMDTHRWERRENLTKMVTDQGTIWVTKRNPESEEASKKIEFCYNCGKELVIDKGTHVDTRSYCRDCGEAVHRASETANEYTVKVNTEDNNHDDNE